MNPANKLDPQPLVQQLLEKTAAGKLDWEPTADRRTFVASLAGKMSFRISMISVTDIGDFGQPETVDVPLLETLDEKGKRLWTSGALMFQALHCPTCMTPLGALATVLTRDWNRHFLLSAISSASAS